MTRRKPVVGVIGSLHLMEGKFPAQRVGERNLRAVAEAAGALPLVFAGSPEITDIAALLDTVGADKAIVGGLSLGGYMSLAFYRAHPDRVRALLIIDTGPGFKKDEAREVWNKRAHDTGDRFEREGL